MTRVDFYILQSATELSRNELACKLVEKAYAQNHMITLMTRSQNHAQEIDTLLWSFKPDSFIPHEIVGDKPSITTNEEETNQTKNSQVAISHEQLHDSHHDIMINLKHEVPKQFSRFNRLIEIVCQSSEVLEKTRESYRFYSSRGYPIHTHKL